MFVLLDFRKIYIFNRVFTLFMKRYPTTLVDSALWEKFVDEIGKRKGMRRGVIQKSLEEAMILWIDKNG